MKKKLMMLFTLACVACLTAALLVGCSGNNDSEKSSDAKSDTTLILGFDQNFPPFGYVDDDGNYTGFDLDVAQAACDRLGWTLQPEPIDWDSKDSLIDSGEITCIWNGFTMEGREDQYAFTEPYYSNSQVILTKDDSGIKSLDDLKNKTVLAQVNSAAYDLLSKGGDQEKLAKSFKSLETIADYNTAFMQLESGAVDAIALDAPVAQQLIDGKDGYTILDGENQLSSESYAVGFKKGNEEQAQQLTQTLRELYEDGTIEKIADEYDAIKYDNWILQ